MVNRIKESISGSVKEKEGYIEAEVWRRKGDNHYSTNEFEDAIQDYEKAKDFYEMAKNAQAAMLELERANKAREKTIELKINDYIQLLEAGDLTSLLTQGFISSQEKKTWSIFFETVDNLSAKITNKVINVNGNKAQAVFTVKMFYRNKSKNAKDERSFRVQLRFGFGPKKDKK